MDSIDQEELLHNIGATALVSVVSGILFAAACVMGDAVALPVQLALKATPEQIKASQNMTLIQDDSSVFIVIYLAVIVLSYCMLKYLNGPIFDGMRYDRDRNFRSRHRLIDNL